LALVGLARSALHELDQVRTQMQSFSKGVRGVVRVCASLSAITQFLARPLRQFSQLYPDIQLQLDEKTSPQVVQAVADNAADIGIYLPVTHGPSLQSMPYREDQLAVIVPKGHPLARRKRVSMQDLVDHPLIGIQSDSAIQIELGRAAAQRGLALRQRFQVSSFDPLCAMVSQGLGIGVLPRSCAIEHAHSKPLQVLTLTDPAARRQFMIGVRHWDSLPPAARLLHQQLMSDAALTQR
jgi:DNA-binding transcriptional LysR family regulator